MLALLIAMIGLIVIVCYHKTVVDAYKTGYEHGYNDGEQAHANAILEDELSFNGKEK